MLPRETPRWVKRVEGKRGRGEEGEERREERGREGREVKDGLANRINESFRMKRVITLMLVLLALVSSAFGQGKPRDFAGYEKKLQKSNQAIENPKKKGDPKTWIARAELMENIHDELQYGAQPGIDAQLFMMMNGTPKAQRVETVGNQQYQVLEMPRTDFYFLEGKLAFCKVNEPLVENPLKQAYSCYMKAIELDTKGKKTKSIAKSLTRLRSLLSNDGVNSYSQELFPRAIEAFDLSLKIAEMPQINVVDTVIHYYAGIASFQANQYDNAAKHFAKCIEHKYYQDGTLFCSYFETMKAMGKPKEGFPMLEKGVELFPEQQCLIMDMIQYNILQGENPEKVIPYVDKAIEKNPTNHVLYFVRGVVYNQLEKPEQALQAYNEALKIKPDYVDAIYNIAALHFNEGVNLQNKAVEQRDAYDRLMEEATASFHRCIEPAEKVLEIEPDHMQALDMLKIVYFRYRQEPGMQAKYDKVQAKIKELKAKGVN